MSQTWPPVLPGPVARHPRAWIAGLYLAGLALLLLMPDVSGPLALAIRFGWLAVAAHAVMVAMLIDYATRPWDGSIRNPRAAFRHQVIALTILLAADALQATIQLAVVLGPVSAAALEPVSWIVTIAWGYTLLVALGGIRSGVVRSAAWLVRLAARPAVEPAAPRLPRYERWAGGRQVAATGSPGSRGQASPGASSRRKEGPAPRRSAGVP